MKTKRLMCLVACLSLLLTGTGMALAQEAKRANPAPGTVTFNFDADIPGQAPAGFTSYASGSGPAGKWVVQEMGDAPSGKRVVVQTDTDDTDNRFPVLIADKEDYADVDVSVKGKAISGKVDRAIGLVFRFRDPQSYYVCRANALEDNLNLYKMVNGRRKQITGAKVKVPSDQWHALQVVAKGDHIVCYFNGQKLIEVQDATYTKGKIGLWTKADSVTAFADLTVVKP
jgi:3-keto-disaccharide hydrolase